MSNEYLELPEIISLASFGGDFDRYLEAVYSLFKRDFIERRPVFRGIRLGLKRYPLERNKEATFWHMTSEGAVEASRNSDLRRMERIEWPAVMINNSTHPYLKVWENIRKGKTNILIFHDKENYLVVLRKGLDYLIPWTAYMVDYKNRKEKLLKEYQEYKKARS